MAINFVKNDDIRILRDIEQYYSTQIDEMPMNGEPPPPRLVRENPSRASCSAYVFIPLVSVLHTCLSLSQWPT